MINTDCRLFHTLLSKQFKKTHLLKKEIIASIEKVISRPDCATAAQLIGVLTQFPDVCTHLDWYSNCSAICHI